MMLFSIGRRGGGLTRVLRLTCHLGFAGSVESGNNYAGGSLVKAEILEAWHRRRKWEQRQVNLPTGVSEWWTDTATESNPMESASFFRVLLQPTTPTNSGHHLPPQSAAKGSQKFYPGCFYFWMLLILSYCPIAVPRA